MANVSSGSGFRTDGVNIAKRANASQGFNSNILNGIYVAEVVNDSDAQHNGRVTVKIPEFGGDTERIILLTTPFGGNTEIKDSTDNVEIESGSPTTYGMWPQPPAIGSNILVGFTGSMEQGFMLGFLPPKDRNATLGGNASSEAYDGNGNKILSQTTEKNATDKNDPVTKAAKVKQTAQLVESGLSGDYVRGHSQSSARRESPSKVFGLTSKMGHTISMDDEATSDNIRIRTSGGNQVLLDDTNGFIFISNKKGNAWIEMDDAGRVDVYSMGGVSIATDGDYNVHAKGSINMQAEQGVNIKSSGAEGVKLESSVGSIDVYSAIDLNNNADGNINITAGPNYYLKAGRVDINGPEPGETSKTTIQAQTSNTSVTESVGSRVPEHHPWKGVSAIQETLKTGKENSG
jgi:hypothetical protein